MSTSSARSWRRLADIHVNYEQQPEYPLTKTEKPEEKLDWRVTKMRLSKDKTTCLTNCFRTGHRTATVSWHRP
jgi:predicted helicase